MLFLGTLAWGALLAAPWVPTLKKQRDLLLDNLPIEADATVYDLGCGSGSILFAVADRYPNARCIGYDVALLPLLIGTLIKWSHPKRYRNVHLRFGNFFSQSVADADVIIAFLMKTAYPKFFAQLTRDVRPGTIVAVEAWPYETLTPTQTITGAALVPWYVYTIRHSDALLENVKA